MKAFLEEYGLVIVIVIVIAALIVLAQAVSKKGAKSINTTTDSMFTAGEKAAADAESAVNMSEIEGAIQGKIETQ